MPSNISRREFIKTSSIAAASVGAGSLPQLTKAQFIKEDKSRVIIAKDELCVEGSTINETRVQDMVDHAIITLTGINNTGKAYEALFPKEVTKDTTIVIKENTKSGGKSRTIVQNAVKKGLMTMLGGQFPEKNITITDGDFVPNSSNNSKFTVGNNEYRIQDIWLNSDYIINIPVCWGHRLQGHGVTMALKNMMSCVRERSGNSPSGLLAYANDEDSPWMSFLNSQPTFKNKQVLVLMDAIHCRSNGGPGGAANFIGYSVYASRDMVANDYMGMKLLEENGLDSRWIDWAKEAFRLAAKDPYNLGIDKEENMEIIEISPPWNPTPNIRESSSSPLFLQVKVISNYPRRRVVFNTPSHKQNVKELAIYDVQGKKVWSFAGMGKESVIWNGKNFRGRPVTKGLYAYNLKINNQVINGKITIRK